MVSVRWRSGAAIGAASSAGVSGVCGHNDCVVHGAVLALHDLVRDGLRFLVDLTPLAPDEALDRVERGLGVEDRLPLGHLPDEPFAGLDPVAVVSLSETLRQRAGIGCTVLFSSHQLDLVQDLCEDIAMVDRGRTVLQGSVASLRASSGRRQLRLHVQAPNRDWLLAYPGVTVVGDEADDLRLEVPADIDPLDVLDAARAAGRVDDFGLDLPKLSELFLAAAERPLDRAGVS